MFTNIVTMVTEKLFLCYRKADFFDTVNNH